MGIATHASFFLQKPTIGVAKNYFKVRDIEFRMPADADMAYTDIEAGGTVYGRALRTHKGIKPIFVSVGNYIDLDTATRIVMSFVNEESRVPVPTRLADLDTHKMRAQYQGAGQRAK